MPDTVSWVAIPPDEGRAIIINGVPKNFKMAQQRAYVLDVLYRNEDILANYIGQADQFQLNPVDHVINSSPKSLVAEFLGDMGIQLLSEMLDPENNKNKVNPDA